MKYAVEKETHVVTNITWSELHQEPPKRAVSSHLLGQQCGHVDSRQQQTAIMMFSGLPNASQLWQRFKHGVLDRDVSMSSEIRERAALRDIHTTSAVVCRPRYSRVRLIIDDAFGRDDGHNGVPGIGYEGERRKMDEIDSNLNGA
ncbi:unnamed protein product [Toxocara canis]|uniref:Uncharacterized protein n=1 Tax=Toxocara canis TaxID=6265 RepID=A0A183U059_TOXCA|nr:unnamed protein product [Toxocara canis]